MDTPQPSWVQRTGTDDRAVLDKLGALQDAGRLAIHVVENFGNIYHYDENTLRDFDAMPAEQIAQHLRDNNATLISTSLLPPRDLNLGMRPFSIFPRKPNNYAYLLNLDPRDKPHPPRVVRAHETGLNTGYQNTLKELQFTTGTTLPALDKIYSAPQFHSDREEEWHKNFVRAIGGEQGAELSSKQLDCLVDWQRECSKNPSVPAPIMRERANNRVMNYNEVVVAANTEHIEAIAIPSFEHDAAAIQFQAALVGLSHIRRGMDLPVVIYHVDGPNMNQFTYVGRTQHELQEVGLQALEQMGGVGMQTLLQALLNYSISPQNMLYPFLKQELGFDMRHAVQDGSSFAAELQRAKDAHLHLTEAPAPAPPRR